MVRQNQFPGSHRKGKDAQTIRVQKKGSFDQDAKKKERLNRHEGKEGEDADQPGSKAT